MDEESKSVGKPSSIKPPMIKPPMAGPVGGAAQQPPAAYQAPMQPSASQQQPAQPPGASANKLLMVINILLAVALIIGLAILAYRLFW